MMGFDGYDMSLWMWIVMTLMMVIVLGGLIVLVVWAVRAVSGARSGSSSSALEMLKRRLAAGEITRDEYNETRRILES